MALKSAFPLEISKLFMISMELFAVDSDPK
jgi:hypothetical protein